MPEAVTAAIGEEVRLKARFDPVASTGLFVGVSAFEDSRITEVPFAVDDAVDLAHLFALELELLQPERTVVALAGEPKKKETRARLAELRELGARQVPARQVEVYRSLGELSRAAGEQGLFLFSIATHGISDQGGDFLIAADSLRERLVRTGIAVDEVFDEIARSPAPRRLALLDACRERLNQHTRDVAGQPMAKSFHDAIAAASGQVILSATIHGGFAYDDVQRRNGVFTAAVCDGLRGAAPADHRGLITVGRLAAFVEEQVAEWVRLHRLDRVSRLQGIGRRTDGAALSLPLAVHLELSRARDRYRDRRGAALALLRENLGRILTGAHYDRVVAALPEELPVSAGVEELLEEVEALDGSSRSQRSLRDYLREVSRASTSPAAARASESPPASERRRAGSTASAGKTGSRTLSSGRPGVRVRKRKQRSGLKVAGNVIMALGLLPVLFLLWLLAAEAYQQLSSLGGSGSVEASKAATEPQEEGIALGRDDPAQMAPGPAGGEAPPAEITAGTAVEGPLGMRFRYVPAGTYTLGSPRNEPGRADWEASPHEVKLPRGLWLGETEVTQGQWSRLVGKNPSRFSACGDDCPVERVSWYEAVSFANLLSDREGLGRCYDLEGCEGDLGAQELSCGAASFRGFDCTGYRLPTQAEWEVAARAGTTSPVYTGELTLLGEHNAPELDRIAWYSGNSGVDYEGGSYCATWKEKQYPADQCGSHPVGGKEENPWGFFDMLGNVGEWMWDRWGSQSSAVLKIDPQGPSEGKFRVFKGGSWKNDPELLRAASVSLAAPDSLDDSRGFRLARTRMPEISPEI